MRPVLRVIGGWVAWAAMGVAAADNVTVVAPTFSTYPENGLTKNETSGVYFDVTNQRSGTNIREVTFELPSNYTGNGGLGPAGTAVLLEALESGRLPILY